MKTRIILSVAIFLFGFIFKGYTQNVTNPVGSHETLKQNKIVEKQDPKKQDLMPSSGAASDYHLSDLGKESSVFFINDWKEGQLVLKDNSVIDNRRYRYNMCSQQMQFINEGDTLAIAIPEEVKLLSFAGHTFVYESYFKDGKVQKGYLELLVEGECQLLVYRWIAYKYVEEMNDCGKRYATERNFLKEEYYVKRDGKIAELVSSNKKLFLDMMADTEVDLKSYMKDNNLKPCKEEDLKQLITYYNFQKH
jgi:hypothetical protein